MDIIEITRQLGEAIQQDERYIAFSLAKEANDNDTALQEAIGKFNMIRMSLDNEISKDDKDDDKVKGYNDDLRRTYAGIMANPTMSEFNEAKSALDVMINEINGIITLCVNGENPKTCQVPQSDCNGSCGGCSGCN